MKHLKYYKESTNYELAEIFVDVLDDGFKFWSFHNNIIYLKRVLHDIDNVDKPMPKYDHSLPKEESDRIFQKYLTHRNAQKGRWIIEAIGIDKDANFEGMLWGNVWRRDSFKDVSEEEYLLYKKAFNACVMLLNYKNEKYINLKIHSVPAGEHGLVTIATQIIAISFHNEITKNNPFK